MSLDPWGNLVEDLPGSLTPGDFNAEQCAMNTFACDLKTVDLADDFWKNNQLKDIPDDSPGGPVTAITINVDTNPPFAGDPKSKLATTASGKGWSAAITWTGGSDPLVKGDTLSASFAITATGKYYFEMEPKTDPDDPDVFKPVTVTITNTTGTKVHTVTPTDAKTLPAISNLPFEAITAESFPLTVNLSGVSTGCSVVRNPDQSKYEYDSTVELTAVPNNRFEGWSGAVTGTTNPVTFQMPNAAATVTARFGPEPPNSGFRGLFTHTVNVAGLAGQSISSDDTSIFYYIEKNVSESAATNTWLCTPYMDEDNGSRPFYLFKTAPTVVEMDTLGTWAPIPNGTTLTNVTIDGEVYSGIYRGGSLMTNVGGGLRAKF